MKIKGLRCKGLKNESAYISKGKFQKLANIRVTKKVTFYQLNWVTLSSWVELDFCLAAKLVSISSRSLLMSNIVNRIFIILNRSCKKQVKGSSISDSYSGELHVKDDTYILGNGVLEVGWLIHFLANFPSRGCNHHPFTAGRTASEQGSNHYLRCDLYQGPSA